MDDDLRNRLRGERPDYTPPVRRPARPLPPTEDLKPVHQQARPTESAATPVAAAPPQPVSQTAKPTKTRRRRLTRLKLGRKKIIITLLVLVILGAGGSAAWLLTHRTASPVPKNIQSAVSYKVYYPDPKKLPAGYYLNGASFSGNGSAVLYAIMYDGGKQKVVVANQPEPGGSIVQNFNNQTLALHTTYHTPIGTATIGAIVPHAVVSLPTNTNVWLILTAPSDINQNQLKQILSSLRT